MTTTVASLEAVFTANTSGLMSGLRNADTAITGFGNKLKDIGGGLTSFGGQLAGLTAPAIGAFGAATNAAMGFDEAMTNANSILQLSSEEIGAISDEILAMGADSLAGPQMLAEAFYEITSGVADASTHMEILSTAVAVSEAGAAGLQGTTAALVGTMNAYGFAAEDAAWAGDVLTRSVALGVFSMDELAAALPNVTGLAAENGIAFDELAAATALISTNGFSAAQATTQLAGVMTAIVKPNEKMIAALDELGYSAADAKALLAEHGLAGAMELINSTSAVAEDGLAAVLGTTEALNGATALLDENATAFIDNFSSGSIALHDAAKNVEMVSNIVKTSIGEDWNQWGAVNIATMNAMTEEMDYLTQSTESYTDSARRVQRASPAAQFKLMKSQVSALAIEVGTALLPAMVELFENVKPLLTQFVEWARENPKLISQIAMVAVGIGVLAGILIPLGLLISTIGTAIAGFGVVLGFILSPIGLVVVALGLLAAAYMTNFMGIQDALKPAVEFLKGAFESIIGWVGDLVSAFQEGGLSGVADFLGEQLTALADSIKNADWGAVWNSIKDKGAELWDNFKASPAADFIFTNLVMPLKEAIVTGDWSGVWGSIKVKAGELWDNFKVSPAADFIFTNFVMPLKQLIYSTDWSAVWESIKIKAGELWDNFKTGLAIAGDFVLTAIVIPFAVSILTTDWGLVWTSMENKATALWANMKIGLTLASDFVMTSIVTPLANMITGTDWGGVINGIVAKGTEIVTSLGTELTTGVAGLATDFANAINALIPDNIHIPIGKITVGVAPFSKTIDFGSIDIPLPNPFKQGTPWTGGMSRDTIAGVVHGQEAVIPTGGMMAKVVPSPSGLMVQGGGRGNGGGMTIGVLNVYGVQNVKQLYDELQKEAHNQSVALGVW